MATTNKMVIENIKIECDGSYIVEHIEPWDYSNTKRYKNYLAVVNRDDKGNDIYNWCKESRNNDEYFNINAVNVGDVLVAGYKDCYKNRGCKCWYKVIDKTSDSIVLVQATTYRKATQI